MKKCPAGALMPKKIIITIIYNSKNNNRKINNKNKNKIFSYNSPNKNKKIKSRILILIMPP